jgi:hypothetical protein
VVRSAWMAVPSTAQVLKMEPVSTCSSCHRPACLADAPCNSRHLWLVCWMALDWIIDYEPIDYVTIYLYIHTIYTYRSYIIYHMYIIYICIYVYIYIHV